jgi:hypothetical protein
MRRTRRSMRVADVVLRSTGQCIGWIRLAVVSPRRWGRLVRRGSRAGLGLVGWGRAGGSGGISGSGRANIASIIGWSWCNAAARSGIGSSRGQSPRARVVDIRKWSDVLGRRRIRRGSRRERDRGPGRHTSVVRGRRRAREVRQRPPSHDRSRESPAARQAQAASV